MFSFDIFYIILATMGYDLSTYEDLDGGGGGGGGSGIHFSLKI